MSNMEEVLSQPVLPPDVIALMNTQYLNDTSQTFTLYRDCAGVELGGIEKFIPLKEFYDLLTLAIVGKQEDEDDSGEMLLMPSNVVLFSKSKSTIKINSYYPAFKGKLTYGTKTYDFPWPNILMYFELTKGTDGFWTVQVCSYMCTDKKPIELFPGTSPGFLTRPNSRDRIWHIPVNNMYSGGGMCYGGNTMPARMSSNLKTLDYYYNVLFDSPFNNDLSIRDLKSNFKPYEGAAYYKYMSEQETFPYSMMTGS